MASAILNIEDAAGIRAFAAKLVADYPALNVVIHNAGIMRPENLLTQADLADAEATVTTNLLGPIRLSAALLPHLQKQPHATIMTVSSGLAFIPMSITPTYNATKAAIHSYTQSLRFQLEGTGVEVIEIMPPAVSTDMTADLAQAGGIPMISTETLVKLVFADLRKGVLEILPAGAKQLAFMRRVAPNFINTELWKAGKKLVPPAPRS